MGFLLQLTEMGYYILNERYWQKYNCTHMVDFTGPVTYVYVILRVVSVYHFLFFCSVPVAFLDILAPPYDPDSVSVIVCVIIIWLS